MLQPATLSFLQELKKHNNKAWFDAHKHQYTAAKTDFDDLVEKIITGYGKTDPDIGALHVKDCVFRIYKDIRFSKDKTPYKTHFGAGLNKGGKKVHYPGYYFHMEPDGLTYCGGGIWQPGTAELKKIRQEIDYNYDEFCRLLQAPKFKRTFGELDHTDMLTRAPQGYAEDNPAISFLKMRSYITGATFADEDLTSPRLVSRIIDTFTALKPLIDFLGRALE